MDDIQVVLVGNAGKDIFLYLVVSDAPPGKDAFVVSGNTVSEVGLWGWVNKMPFTPIRLTLWHNRLWSGPEDEDWVARFVDRTKPFTKAEMKEMGAISLKDVPLPSSNPNNNAFYETISQSSEFAG